MVIYPVKENHNNQHWFYARQLYNLIQITVHYMQMAYVNFHTLCFYRANCIIAVRNILY